MSEPDAPPSPRALRHRAERLVTLARLDTFGLLAEEAAKKEDRMREDLVSRLHDPEADIEMLKKQAEYNRGFSDGMRYVTEGVPGGAAKVLAQRESEEEVETVVDRWAIPD